VAEGFAVYRPALNGYAEVIRQEAYAAGQVGQRLAEIGVPSGAFGKLPESGDLEGAYRQHADAEVDNADQLPKLLNEVAEDLTGTAWSYQRVDASQARSIQQMFGQATTYAATPASRGVARAAISKSLASSARNAYSWVNEPERALPELSPLQKLTSGGIGGALDDAALWVLEKTGLLEMLDQVTGAPDALHAAAEAWRSQGTATQQVAGALRSGASNLPEQWQGATSEAFGGFMGGMTAALDAMASDMGQTGQILNEAAQEGQFAQDTITMIIQQVAEWVIGSIALDVLTLGFGTVVDSIIDSAEVAGAVAQAGEAVIRLEQALIKLKGALANVIQEAGRDDLLVQGGLSAGVSDIRQVEALSGDTGWQGLGTLLLDGSVQDVSQHQEAVRDLIEDAFGEDPATGREAYHLPLSQISAILNPAKTNRPQASPES
jgi:uncharacterized protein YukE